MKQGWALCRDPMAMLIAVLWYVQGVGSEVLTILLGAAPGGFQSQGRRCSCWLQVLCAASGLGI